MKYRFFHKTVTVGLVKGFGRISMLFLLLSLALLGCTTPSPSNPTPKKQHTPTSFVTSTPIKIFPTSTSENPTATPTKTFPVWTPLPTYPPSERRNVVMNLYENPVCRLPCWWGITPGETDWHEAWQFLARFAINQAPYDTHIFESDNLPDYQLFQVLLDVPKGSPQDNHQPLNHLIFFMRKGAFLIEYIDVNTGNLNLYTIPQILAAYGQPEQVYVLAWGSQQPTQNSVRLYLYYPKQGFMSIHFATVGQDVWTQNEFTACFQKYTRLILWPKGKLLDEEIAAGLFLGSVESLGHNPYQPIEEVSNLDTTKFFDAFVGSSKQVCLNISTANLDR